MATKEQTAPQMTDSKIFEGLGMFTAVVIVLVVIWTLIKVWLIPGDISDLRAYFNNYDCSQQRMAMRLYALEEAWNKEHPNQVLPQDHGFVFRTACN